MKLYVLKRPYERGDWDCIRGFVIRAESETEARMIAEGKRADEAKGTWIDSERSSCVELTRAGDKGIILIDFHAG